MHLQDHKQSAVLLQFRPFLRPCNSATPYRKLLGRTTCFCSLLYSYTAQAKLHVQAATTTISGKRFLNNSSSARRLLLLSDLCKMVLLTALRLLAHMPKVKPPPPLNPKYTHIVIPAHFVCTQSRHTTLGHEQRSAWLCASRDLQLHWPVNCCYFDLGAQDCINIADLNVTMDVDALSSQLRMVLHTDVYNEVAWRGTTTACVTFSLDSKAGTIVNACRIAQTPPSITATSICYPQYCNIQWSGKGTC